MNQWLHVAAVYDGNNISVYVEGKEMVTTQNVGSVATTTYPLGIGYCPETASFSWERCFPENICTDHFQLFALHSDALKSAVTIECFLADLRAEVTINYVITDVERKRKFVCVDPHDMPIIAVHCVTARSSKTTIASLWYWCWYLPYRQVSLVISEREWWKKRVRH